MLVAVALGAVLAPLNSTMIAVAIPEIAGDFDASISSVGWLVTAYLIVIGAFQPVAGRLGDRYGRRRLFLLGLVGFAAASLGAALAPNLAVLIAFRVVQAIAGGLSFPNGAALVRFAVPPERRAASFGVVWGVASAAAAIGPTLGGLIVEGSGWRAMFYASVPVAVAATVLGLRTLPRSEVLTGSEVAATSTIGLLRNRGFSAATAGIALSNLAMYTTLLAVPIVLIDDRAWSVAAAGLGLTVLSAPSAVLSPVGGRLADRYGRRHPAVLGLSISTVALLPLALGVESPASLLACLGFAGVGFGLAFVALQTAAIESAPVQSAGAAAGLFSTSRYVGGIVGSLVLGLALESAPGEVTGFQVVAAVIVVSSLLSVVAALGLRGRRGVPELADVSV